jgi:hypothetical protein
LALALAGCGGGSERSETVAAPSASAQEDRLGGRGVGAGEDALAFLLADDSHAQDLDALAEAVVDSTPVSADGSFAFAPGAQGDWVLISAPGKALARTRAVDGLELTLEGEARIRVDVGEPYACALVLDERGAPLPLPAEHLVSTLDGVLTATRLPAGRLTVVAQSADGARYGKRELDVTAGERVSLRLQLTPDLDSARSFLGAVGGEATRHPLYPEERR